MVETKAMTGQYDLYYLPGLEENLGIPEQIGEAKVIPMPKKSYWYQADYIPWALLVAMVILFVYALRSRS